MAVPFLTTTVDFELILNGCLLMADLASLKVSFSIVAYCNEFCLLKGLFGLV
jgi:hypothetical protein